ncbi:2-amino-3,7-dideoxy-D-threo-hept-6-ulosonate synthase [Variovorax paradoxus]|uniref:2-amino-3,7-dideoxy-D-threo-hept-6-ulosonate synthase n=1 Tax=Variovorax paradoxus TaxID=34073 RepID=UPI001ABC6D4D
MASGRKLRLGRLVDRVSHRTLLVPLDHGATVGPIDGISKIRRTIAGLGSSGANIQGVVVHRGVAGSMHDPMHGTPMPLVLHLSASTSLARDSTHKILVAQVEDALVMGADAVSVHVNLGALAEAGMLRDMGAVASQCERWGMPLLAMVYTHGESASTSFTTRIAHAARLAAELGADMVKVNYPGSPEAMAEVVEGCFVPVLVAGGERSASEVQILDVVDGALQGGAGGVCMGRNVFQHPDPSAFLARLSRQVHGFDAHRHAAPLAAVR